MLKTYNRKANALRAARKLGVNPALVQALPSGGFGFNFTQASPIGGGVTAARLAYLFDCSSRHVQQLAARGIVKRIGRNLYDEPASTAAYISHLRELVAARVGQDPSTDAVVTNVKHKEALARLLEIRLEKESAALVSVADARETWQRIETALRRSLRAIPAKLAAEIPTLTAHDVSVLGRIVEDGLEDANLADGYLRPRGDEG